MGVATLWPRNADTRTGTQKGSILNFPVQLTIINCQQRTALQHDKEYQRERYPPSHNKSSTNTFLFVINARTRTSSLPSNQNSHNGNSTPFTPLRVSSPNHITSQSATIEIIFFSRTAYDAFSDSPRELSDLPWLLSVSCKPNGWEGNANVVPDSHRVLIVNI
jgi:hypothetical protein